MRWFLNKSICIFLVLCSVIVHAQNVVNFGNPASKSPTPSGSASQDNYAKSAQKVSDEAQAAIQNEIKASPPPLPPLVLEDKTPNAPPQQMPGPIVSKPKPPAAPLAPPTIQAPQMPAPPSTPPADIYTGFSNQPSKATGTTNNVTPSSGTWDIKY